MRSLKTGTHFLLFFVKNTVLCEKTVVHNTNTYVRSVQKKRCIIVKKYARLIDHNYSSNVIIVFLNSKTDKY